jgi:hypothetical protein
VNENFVDYGVMDDERNDVAILCLFSKIGIMLSVCPIEFFRPLLLRTGFCCYQKLLIVDLAHISLFRYPFSASLSNSVSLVILCISLSIDQ